MSTYICRAFVDPQQNALMTALVRAAGASDETDNEKIYGYIEQAPKASFVCELTQELNNLGYKIALSK